MKDLIDILDLSVDELDELIDTALDIIEHPAEYSECCRKKKLATLFFEPSTRTRLSFEAAMYELGGNVLGFSEANSSSASKGESVADTARIVAGYADIIAMRHPLEGAPLVAALHAPVPVINAGDGGHHHPTQTLADLLTIRREKHRLDHLTIGLCGDLKYGRTVHSLLAAMSRYPGGKFVLISPPELRLPEYVKRDILQKNGLEFCEVSSLEDSMPELDVLYMTRIQKERFSDESEYQRLKDSYILTPQKLLPAKRDLCILHPLPRVNEISVEVDQDPRACYFEQAKNGKYMRMALILKLLNLKRGGETVEPQNAVKHETEQKKEEIPALVKNKFVCSNPRCITSTEQGLEQVFRAADAQKGIYRCYYCDTACAVPDEEA